MTASTCQVQATAVRQINLLSGPCYVTLSVYLPGLSSSRQTASLPVSTFSLSECFMFLPLFCIIEPCSGPQTQGPIPVALQNPQRSQRQVPRPQCAYARGAEADRQPLEGLTPRAQLRQFLRHAATHPGERRLDGDQITPPLRPVEVSPPKPRPFTQTG